MHMLVEYYISHYSFLLKHGMQNPKSLLFEIYILNVRIETFNGG